MSFPASPTTGQQATEGGRLYQWTGSVWDLVATVTGHAAQHAAGGSDQLTISASQVTGLGSLATASSVVTADIADGAVTLAKTTGIQKTITSGTALPTGGSSGDIYLRYS